MSLARAEDKLKEFFYYVSSSTARWLSNAYDALEKFYESYDIRHKLMTNIRMAIEYSLGQACDAHVMDCATALHLFGDIMMLYGYDLARITIDADINAFIEFLDKAIEILSMHSRYIEWARKSWEGTMEILRMIFKV
jgi:hypothetical protein